MKLRHLFILQPALFAVALNAASLSITPGSLASQLTEADKAGESLTLTGSMDIRDFNTLTEEMTALCSLDLSGVTIAVYESPVAVTSGPMRHDADCLPDGALLGLKLTSLKLPSTLRSLGEGSLAGCQFSELALPSSLVSISDNALYGCENLVSITLPASVSSIGTYAFAGCTALENADLSASQLTEISVRLFAGDASLASVSLPSAVTLLGEGCFADTPALKQITLPQGLTTIGTHAFTGSGLTGVTLPASVNMVGDFAFSNCKSLTSATLGNPKAELGRGLFFADPEFVTFEAAGIERFPDYLFTGDGKYESKTESLKEIGDYALMQTGAHTLIFGADLAGLGDGALEGMTALKDIDVQALKSSVPVLGKEVFAGIDCPNVSLTVAKDQKEVWMAADQWKEFNIKEVNITGIDGVNVPSAVRCRFSDTVLLIDSDKEITLVEVCDPTGSIVIKERPHAFRLGLQTAHLAAKIYIVRVHTDGGAIETFKLIR